MTLSSRAIHDSNWKAPARPSSGLHSDTYVTSIWQTELCLLDNIISEIRALRSIVEHSDSENTTQKPVVVAVLPSIDPETAQKINYEIVDVDGNPIWHPQIGLVGHQLLLRTGAELPEADGGCAAFHLRVTTGAGLSTIEEFVLQPGDAIENCNAEGRKPLSETFRAPNRFEIYRAIDEPI